MTWILVASAIKWVTTLKEKIGFTTPKEPIYLVLCIKSSTDKHFFLRADSLVNVYDFCNFLTRFKPSYQKIIEHFPRKLAKTATI